jgi:hypothetical protein
MARRLRTTAGSLIAGIGVLLSLQACASTSGGNPTAAESTTASSHSSPSATASQSVPASDPDLAALDPCKLVTSAELTQLGLPTESRPATGRQACNWAKQGAVLGIYVRPSQGLADLNTNRATRVEDRTIGNHQGRLVERPDGCDIDIAVTDRSSATVSITMIDAPSGACALAERAAGAVEPRLPRG